MKLTLEPLGFAGGGALNTFSSDDCDTERTKLLPLLPPAPLGLGLGLASEPLDAC